MTAHSLFIIHDDLFITFGAAWPLQVEELHEVTYQQRHHLHKKHLKQSTFSFLRKEEVCVQIHPPNVLPRGSGPRYISNEMLHGPKDNLVAAALIKLQYPFGTEPRTSSPQPIILLTEISNSSGTYISPWTVNYFYITVLIVNIKIGLLIISSINFCFL